MAPASATASKPATSARSVSVDVDLVRSYLRDIGRVPLLTHEQEITLGRQVQDLMDIEAMQTELESRDGDKPSPDKLAKASGLTSLQLKRKLQHGRRAKERMVAANLRLVVSVAKKYTKRNMELLDLIQEGTIGLVRGVEKFDPTRGYKFSTYAYWWIRQGITRAIATQSRTIRLPVHITEKLNRIKKAQRDIASRLGRTATLKDLSAELNLPEEVVRQTLMRVPRSVSLDTRVGRDMDTELGDLLEDGMPTPEQRLTREKLHDDLLGLLGELSGREARVIRLRFGLDDDTPQTLAEIGKCLDLSRERVRQIESRALHKLRLPERRGRVKDYLEDLD